MSEWIVLVLFNRVLLVGCLLLSTPPASITKKNFDSIKPGMQQHKVESLLGGAPGGYRSGPTVSCLPGFASLAVEDQTLRKLTWQGDEANIKVWINPKGVVTFSSYELRKPKSLGAISKLVWRCDRWRKSLTVKGQRK